MTTNQTPDLNNGITMEVPYKLFSNPAAFWGIVRRNVLVAIQKSNTVFDTLRAGEAQAHIIRLLNGFTSRPTFNAMGVLNDGQEPSDDVYQEWTKGLRFFLTLVDKGPGVVQVTLGIQSRNPWKGILVEAVGDVYFEFYMKDGKYFMTPFVDMDSKPTNYSLDEIETIGIKPFHTWFHGSNHATGEIPKLVSHAELREVIGKYSQDLKEKLAVFGGETSNISLELDEQLERFNEWNGGSLMLAQASIYSRLIPIGNSQHIVYTNFSGRGDYELNFYGCPVRITK